MIPLKQIYGLLVFFSIGSLLDIFPRIMSHQKKKKTPKHFTFISQQICIQGYNTWLLKCYNKNQNKDYRLNKYWLIPGCSQKILKMKLRNWWKSCQVQWKDNDGSLFLYLCKFNIINALNGAIEYLILIKRLRYEDGSHL